MNIMLKQRVKLLQTAGVIDDDVAEYTNQIIDFLTAADYDQRKMEVFTTHLAMASQRIKNNEPAGQLGADIWQQVVRSPYYQNAAVLFEQISQPAPVVFPESEKQFMIMHLCNLMNREG